MQLFNSKLLARLLALLLAVCMIAGCFAGCADSSNDDDDDDEKSSKKDKDDEEEEDEDPRDGLEIYTLNGLYYYLGDEFGGAAEESADYVLHASGNDMTIEVTCGPMEDVADSDIDSSKEFAQFFVDEMGSYYEDIQSDSANGVHYIVADVGDGSFQVCGFYTQSDYGWVILATTEDEDNIEELINYVTLGKVEVPEDFTPDYYNPGEDVEEYEDYEDVDDDPGIYEGDYESDSDTFTVHAYIPDSWGHPGCWAWSNTTGENVFAAWPGEPMTWNGDHYVIDIPMWAEYIIVNGNEGSIQTQDEPVEYGSDIWIVVYATGDTYDVYFSEPSSDLLSEQGY